MEEKFIKFINILKDGKVTIPKELREEMDLQDGEVAMLYKTEAGILIKPLKAEGVKLL